MGCIGRLGCLVMVALLAIGAFLTRDQWLPRLTGRPIANEGASVSVWQPLSPEAGARGKQKIDELSSPPLSSHATVTSARRRSSTALSSVAR